jgi:ribosomal protein L31
MSTRIHLWQDSLKAIATSVGGHYRISALTDHEGEIEITTAVHPYWASSDRWAIYIGRD